MPSNRDSLMCAHLTYVQCLILSGLYIARAQQVAEGMAATSEWQQDTYHGSGDSEYNMEK